MNWGALAEATGLPENVAQDAGLAVVALASILFSVAVSFLIAPPAARAAAGRARRWFGPRPGWDDAALSRLIRKAVCALLIAIVAGLIPFPPLSLTIIGVALGALCGTLVAQLVRAFGLSSAMTAGAGVIAAGLVVVRTLGGLAPVTAQMSAIGLPIGDHYVSLLSLLNFLIVAFILYAVARFISHALTHWINRLNAFDASQKLLFQKLAGLCVIVVALLLGVDLLGIDLTALAVFSGAVGLAVGFGLQKTLGNLLAGLILLMDRSIKPGDVIVVGDTFGAVSKIGVRAVSVVTRDGKEHLIPNEQLMTEAVENWSYSDRNVRVHIPVGVSYDADLAMAQKLMIEAASAPVRALKSPAPTVWLKGFGDSAVDHDILVWIADPEAGVGNIQSEILNRLWVLFKENGVEIPYPQRDLHIRSMPGLPADGEGLTGR